MLCSWIKKVKKKERDDVWGKEGEDPGRVGRRE